MNHSFPAQAVIAGFSELEHRLCSILKVIPYCKEHEDVWSDAFVSPLVDGCSLLDSLWRHQSKLSALVTKERADLSMLDYFKFFGQYMEPKWMVFWGEDPVVLKPYEGWSKTGQYTMKNDCSQLSWWSAYNTLKHDRLKNRKEATLKRLVTSIGALLLAILRSEDCRIALAQTDWLRANSTRPEVLLGEDSPGYKNEFASCETKFFSYAISWGTQPIPAGKKMHWSSQQASPRFVRWFCNV